MKKFALPTLLTGLMVMILSQAFAQNKAQIHIRKNQNGVQSEETREIQLNDDESIQDILIQMGVLDELGQLKDGQEIEIRIDKRNGTDSMENFELFLGPEHYRAAPISPLPPFAPAPKMESRPLLGVMLKEVNNYEGKENKSEVIITEVIEGSAAVDAGLMVGDVIVEIDDKEVQRTFDVINTIQNKAIGDEVKIEIVRNGKKLKKKAKLGETMMEAPMFRVAPDSEWNESPIPGYNFRFGPDSITIFCPQGPGCLLPNDSMKICQPFSWNGEGMAVKEMAFLGVTPVDEQTAEGVKVNVEEGTSAESMGVQNGDIVQSINDTEVKTFDQLAEVIGAMEPGQIVRLKVLRDGRQKEISGEIGKRSVSGFEDFRIFHDFKGMDEGGNYFYDYEFDMDEEDIEMRMQELLGELDRQQEIIEDERNRIQDELSRIQEEREVIVVKIQIAEISQEEAEEVNKIAQPKLQVTNDLKPDQISFFPNPNDGILNLSFSTTEKSPVKVVLYNATGEVVYLEERTSFDGQYNKMIDISDEPNGTYFLQILQGAKSYSKKIIKGK